MIPVTLEIERFLSVYIPPPFAVTGGVGVVVPASDSGGEDSVFDPGWEDAVFDSDWGDAANEFLVISADFGSDTVTFFVSNVPDLLYLM